MNLQSIKLRYGIIGRSDLLDRALDTAVRVAPTDLTVLVTGESGVGKEVFSKIIHALSPRKHNNFIAVNSGAIPAGTINSELFGHEKGAFTGASADRKGYFETTNGGTIFLDEIGEMPLDTQALLLRVLESGEFIRVGGSKVLKTEVRVIAATNVDLEERVRKGKFREDLYYRLNTIRIKVPSLKERREDIFMLFRKFTVDFSEKYRMNPIQLDEKARLLLENYKWPGNIRELKNVAEQISIMAEERMVTAADLLDFMPHITSRNLPVLRAENGDGNQNFEEREILYKLLFDMKADMNDLKNLVFGLIQKNDLTVPETNNLPQIPAPSYRRPNYEASNFERDYPPVDRHEVNDYEPADNVHQPIIIGNDHETYDTSEVVEESLSLADMEKEYIQKALKKHNGRRKDAADDLGISERTLYRKIKEYDI